VKHKSYLHLYAWTDTLIEVGQKHEVGAGIIAKLKEVIREAYQNGFKDGRAAGQEYMRARGHAPGRRVSR